MAKREPFILVTNDDGIFTPGIRAMVNVAREFGEVLVVAPDKPQSGMGHAITVNDPLRMREYELDPDPKIRSYSCNGTPVDSVKLAISLILQGKPDLLLSGINHGSNSSINVLYSGTMSAAVEGALEGIPSVGCSLLDYRISRDMSTAEHVTRKVVHNALNREFPDRACLNVNIPDISLDELKGIRVCRQAKAYWEDDFEVRKDPHGKEYYWLAGEFKNFDKGTDTDIWALENGYASIVPVQYDMTAHYEIEPLHDWDHEL